MQDPPCRGGVLISGRLGGRTGFEQTYHSDNCLHKITKITFQHCLGRDGKTYKRESNTCLNLFLAWVKSVPNCKLFCRKSRLCRNFALFWVTLMAFN